MEKANVVSVTTRTTYVFSEEEIEAILFKKIGVKKEFGVQCVFDTSGDGFFREVRITVEKTETTEEGEA